MPFHSLPGVLDDNAKIFAMRVTKFLFTAVDTTVEHGQIPLESKPLVLYIMEVAKHVIYRSDKTTIEVTS